MNATIDRKYQRLRQELVGGGFALIGVFFLGTLGYRAIEGWHWSEAAYMTAITLSTVGFSEVHPLDERGQIFTIALIAMGIVSIGYIANRFTEALIQGYFQETMRLRQYRHSIETLTDHYILCGYSRTGRQIAREFRAEGVPFVIINSNLETTEEARAEGYTVLQGDATLDENLHQVKVEKATCIVTALPSDAENLYVVLSAKTLNPQIRAIARANTEEAVQKLQRAGADAVVSPYVTGGIRLAAAALRPQVMDFVDGILTGADRSFYMEEFLIEPERCNCIGLTLRDTNLRGQSGALVLAIRRRDGTLIGGPTGDTIVHAGDVLICIGTAEQLRSLNKILSPLQRRFPRLPKHYVADGLPL